MTCATYYRWGLWAPIALPVVIAAAYLLLPEGAVPDALAPLLIALVVGGVPYAIVAFILSLWLRDRSARTARRVAFLLPVVFALGMALVGAGMGLVGAAIRDSSANPAMKLGVVFGLYALLVGYFYAVLIEVVRVVAVKLRLVDPLPSR